MRSVTIFERIPNSQNLRKAGEGLFHAWGISYDELNGGVGMFTTAVVELPTGSVINIDADLIRFNVPVKETEG